MIKSSKHHQALQITLPGASRRRFALVAWLVSAMVAGAENPNSIVNSKHNLSVSGPGTVRSATESDICIFCHTPHGASAEGPLWNHQISTATYIPYNSSTLRATVGQPTGASKLCLSCHDGTVALGMVLSRPSGIAMPSGSTTMPAGSARVGTDLSVHHPVSFNYDSALATASGELRDPAALSGDVRLDKSGQLQCTSCHDPHNNQYGQFLVKDNTASAMCQDCHTPNHWSPSVHATSTATWNGSGQNPWPHTTRTTVADNACENCHRPHDAQTPKRLLNFATEELNCNSCHGGTVAAKNVAAEFSKTSAHPVTMNTGVHDPVENAVVSTRHVECVDCHNSHAATAAAATAPAVPGSLKAVRGVNASGAEVQEAQYEYEVCFRCHADSGDRGSSRVQRQFSETNTRLEFDQGNTSFHPVEGVGKNSSVPSLILPWTVSSMTYCGDCHNNNQGPGNGGSGPNGPHGSAHVPLLERQLLLTDLTAYNANNFALCYKCHSETVVNSDLATSWLYHKKHIEEFRAACTTCHDSHASNQPHLINFNTTYVLPYNGLLNYTSTGVNHGSCTLSCHDGSGQNKPHNPKTY